MKENEDICLLFGHIFFMALIFTVHLSKQQALTCVSVHSSAVSMSSWQFTVSFQWTSLEKWRWAEMQKIINTGFAGLGHMTGDSWKWDSRHFQILQKPVSRTNRHIDVCDFTCSLSITNQFVDMKGHHIWKKSENSGLISPQKRNVTPVRQDWHEWHEKVKTAVCLITRLVLIETVYNHNLKKGTEMHGGNREVSLETVQPLTAMIRSINECTSTVYASVFL